MSNSGKLRTVTLVGAETFAGIAAARMAAVYPDLGSIQYVSTAQAMFEGLLSGSHEVIVGAEASTNDGFSPFFDSVVAPLGATTYIIAELIVPFSIAVLGRPGTRGPLIQKIYGGHVSLAQAAAYLREFFASAETVVYSSPLEAVRQVLAGSGREAIIGSSPLGKRYGLTELARVPGAGEANFWALSSQPLFAEEPSRVIIAGRIAGNGELGELAFEMHRIGFRMMTDYSQPSGQGLFEFDSVLRFCGTGRRADIEELLRGHDGLRLAGAFVFKEEARDRDAEDE